MITIFGAIMVLAGIIATVCLILTVVAFLEDDDAKLPLFIIGCACLAIFIIQSKIVHKDEVFFYGDEYDIVSIKQELDDKGIKGYDEQISITDREYIKTYYSRFDGCTYYDYAVHPGDVQVEDFEQYKKVE